MAFENFDEASKHINLIWGSVDVWWYDPGSKCRRKYLDCFFKVKKNWFEEWSNYVRFLKKELNIEKIKVCVIGQGFIGLPMSIAVSNVSNKNNKPLFDVIGLEKNDFKGNKLKMK